MFQDFDDRGNLYFLKVRIFRNDFIILIFAGLPAKGFGHL